MSESERNLITGTTQKKFEAIETNSITGMPIEKQADNADNNDEPKWPSISDVEKREEEQEQEEAGQVEKSTDERPWPSITGQLVGNDSEGSQFEKSISLKVPVFAVEKKGDEHIVMGIVYEPDTVDAQGDQASEEEIRKAAYLFMENVQQFKVMHKGKAVNIKVLESYIAPQQFTINKRTIKKGSWVLVTRINDKKLWKAIKDGKFTGYSMAGYAKVD